MKLYLSSQSDSHSKGSLPSLQELAICPYTQN